jgi:hypothetical protein
LAHPIRIALLSAAALVVLAALYTAWWFTLADKWRDGITRWTAAMEAQGWTVATGDLAISGFPGALRIAVPTPKMIDKAGNGWTGPAATLAVSPFAPLDPRFAASGHHLFALAGHAPVDIEADSLTGHLTAARGGPRAITVEARQITTGAVILDGFRVEAHKLDAPPADGNAPVLSATAEIDRLALPEGAVPMLDHTLSVAHLALRLRGAIPSGPPKEALAAWRDAGGTVEIDSLDLDWPPLAGAGSATLALDKGLQPELAGSVTLRGLTTLVDRMVQVGMMKPGPAVAAKVVLSLAAHDGPDGMPENKVAVTLQNRVLSLGPAKVMELPEVEW